jgi:hypothetical protein
MVAVGTTAVGGCVAGDGSVAAGAVSAGAQAARNTVNIVRRSKERIFFIFL